MGGAFVVFGALVVAGGAVTFVHLSQAQTSTSTNQAARQELAISWRRPRMMPGVFGTVTSISEILLP